MKATTIAATAAILGSVSADGWEGWSNSTDDATTTTSADPTWTEWSTSSTSKSSDPSSESSWTEWTSSTPAASTSTSYDPATWSDRSSTSTSSKPNTATSKTSKDPQTWSEWSSTTTSKSAPATSTDPATWSEWDDGKKSSSTPAVKTSTDSATWGTWSARDPKTTLTSTSTQWVTVTVYHNDGGETWSAWSEPATATSTKTDSKTVIVSSTITKTASASTSASTSDGAWSAWATPSLAVDPNCKLQISVSYGLPIWVPTASVNWDDWNTASSTSSTPAVKTSTSTASTSWGEWPSTTTSSKSKTAKSTSTDPATWSQWDGTTTTSSKPNTATSTSTSSATWASWGNENKVVDPTGAAQSWSAWSSSATGSKTSSSGSAAQTWGSWNTDNNGISANGNKFGMTYSPYTADSQCKGASVVAADIAAMAAKGFTSVRVYSTDCQTLENVGKAARDNKMKVILGVFISETGISGAQPQVDAIAKWAQWDLVELIVVGNEAVFGGRCDAGSLASFIASSKATFKAAGFKGAVTTTEELSIWQGQGSAWCDVVDVVTANLYAFFNPNTAAEDAGSFIQAQINDLSKICPGKEVYVMESGWPSAGECNGKACPSPENQATAIKGIQAAVGAKVVFFSYEDEAWKTPGQFGVEQHWGCGEVFQ